MDATQPKINRKLVQRSAVLAVAAAVLLAVYVWLTGQNKDVDLGSVHSAGWIAALQLQRDGGSRLVVIKPDGSIVPCPGYKSGSTDREFAWRPDGNRIFFSSDRQDKTYNIFRWNLATGQVERRTLGKIAKSDPSFPVGDPGASHPLIVFSGEAWDLDPGSGKASQVFPIPPDKHKEVDTRDESSGERLGAFGLGAQQKVRTARYLKGKTYVVVIRRTDEGEMLVLQRLIPPEGKSPDEVKRDMQSYVVAAGDRIVIDVNPRTGTLVFASQGFHFPNPNEIPDRFVKDGKVTHPFEHAVQLFDPDSTEAPAGPVVASRDDAACFGQIAVSPDGASLLMTAGPYHGSGDSEAKQLFVVPTESGGIQHGLKVFPEAGKSIGASLIYSPSWSSDGRTIVFGLSTQSGERALCSIGRDGKDFRNLTAGKGNFTNPKSSPQLAGG